MTELPRTAVPARVGIVGALGAVAAMLCAFALSLGTGPALIFLVLGGAVPMWLLEWRQVERTQPPPAGPDILLGLVVVVALAGLSAWMQLTIGGGLGAAAGDILLPGIASAALAFIVALLRPRWLGENIAALGRVVRGFVRARRLANGEMTLILGWMIKCFFLPLMLGWALGWLTHAEAKVFDSSALAWFAVPLALMYAIDTSFAAIGYMSTSRHLGAEIRSVDRTWLGWLSALVCYPPLSVWVLDAWLVYKHGADWTVWLAIGSLASYLWGGAILALTAIYTWGTVAFGPRFSNLTHRGIVTHGPYRWGKHPAYLAKNLSWWLMWVPFLPVMGWGQALVHSLSLLCVNVIYYLRARTEERHLLHDPVYRQYADWIAEHGLLARILRPVGWGRNRRRS
jgi:hypothetical protein